MIPNALTMYEETSFWARDYGPYTPNAALMEPIEVDVAVVGGGFLGLNAAREFKNDNPNARVAVLEGAVIGYGASGRNAGFSMTLFGLEPQVTKLRWGKERTAEACRYMVKAVNFTKALVADHRLDSDYFHPGLLRVGYSAPQVKTLEGAYRVYEDLGVADEMGMRWVEQDELRSQFNSPLFTRGLFETHAGLLHPCKHVRELKRLALEAGAEVYEQTPVTSIEREVDAVLLTTPESLSSLLSQSPWREGFRPFAVVVDEIHAFAESKRGSLLALSLERLEERSGGPLQRIGLSATAWPKDPAYSRYRHHRSVKRAREA